MPTARMTTFRCGSCGARIAVSDRHLGRVMVCPECGDSTHPVAVHLSERRTAPPAAEAPAPPASARTPAPAQRCANCGQAIGRLQRALRWEGHVVCVPCHRALTAEAADQAAEAVPAIGGTQVTAGEKPAAKPITAEVSEPFARFRRLLPWRGRRQRPAAESSSTAIVPVPKNARPATVLVAVPDSTADSNDSTPAPTTNFGPPAVAEIAFDLRGLMGLLIGVGLVGAVVFFALSLLNVVVGIAIGVVLALVGLYCLRRGSLAVRKRFEQLDHLRAEHGTAGVLSMLKAWARSQPRGRLPWVVTVVTLGGLLYPLYLATNWIAARGGLVKPRHTDDPS